MEKYHKESRASLIQITLTLPSQCSNCCVWVYPVSPQLSHSRVLPERSSEPWHSLSSPPVPDWCAPLRTAQFPSLHASQARFEFLQNLRTGWLERQLQLYESVWLCLDNGGSLIGRFGGVQQGQGQFPPPSYRSSLRKVIQQWLLGVWPHYMDFLIRWHLWCYLLLLERLLVPLSFTSLPNFSQWIIFENDRMGSRTGAALQKQTLLWFIVGESLTLWLHWRWRKVFKVTS